MKDVFSMVDESGILCYLDKMYLGRQTMRLPPGNSVTAAKFSALSLSEPSINNAPGGIFLTA